MAKLEQNLKTLKLRHKYKELRRKTELKNVFERLKLRHKYRMLRVKAWVKNLRLEYLRLKGIVDLLRRNYIANYIAPPQEQRPPAARARGSVSSCTGRP
jgi:hypothetical protein